MGKILMIAGVAAGAYLGLTMLAKGQSGDASNPEGSLGGSDSLTAEGNPLARIDPNSIPNQKQAAPGYFLVQPDGSVVKTEMDPSTGDIWTGANPSTPGFSVDPNAGGNVANQPGASVSSPKWYESPLGQAVIFGGGIAAADLSVRAGAGKLKDVFSGAKTSELVEGAGVKEGSFRAERSPVERINEKLGIGESPEGKILRNQYVVDGDVAAGPKSGFKETIGKAGEIAGKALIVGHVVQRSFGAWNEYGSQMLVQEGGYTPGKGYETHITAGSKAAAVGMTAAKGTTNILADLFGFTTGFVYRPHTDLEDLKGQKEGWFATEQDLFDYAKYGLQDPLGAMKGLIGYDQVAAAFKGSNDAARPTNPAAYTQPSMQTTSDKLMVSMQGPAPSTPTQPSVVVKAPSKDLKINKSTGSYEASKVTFVQPARDSSGKTAMDRQIESNKKASDAKKASGQTFKGYDSKGKAVWK